MMYVRVMNARRSGRTTFHFIREKEALPFETCVPFCHDEKSLLRTLVYDKPIHTENNCFTEGTWKRRRSYYDAIDYTFINL